MDAHLPEDAGQDEIDALVRRIQVVAEQAGQMARVRTELREGRVWIIADLTPEPQDEESP